MIKLDYNFMMQEHIGAHGMTEEGIKKDLPKIQKALEKVVSNSGKGWQEWTELVNTPKKELDELVKFGADVRKKCEHFVVFGIGGSGLGPLAVASALLHFRHNELPKEKRNAPKYYIEDNIDPNRMAGLLDVIDIKTSYFNVITKSGETSETLSQFFIVYETLKKVLGEKEAKERIIVTTTVGKGTLYEIAKKEGFRIFDIGKGVGGRFSVFSNVGLVPFAVLGIDIHSLIDGAKASRTNSEINDISKNVALITAYLQVKSMENGKNISVLMPYSDPLKFMADFYAQLWGESLAKEVDNDGNKINCGQSPVKALGTTDQHSQVQLFMEGPFDKVVTFLAVEDYVALAPINETLGVENCDFLKGRSLNDLISAQMKATIFALKKQNRPSFTLSIEKVNAFSVGELLQYFMYQTAFAGAMLNIDTYNQPGVEEGKKATFAMMNRKGYEDKLKEVEAVKLSKSYQI
ncbi:MAG: glucose-6-phosphate isomerase [Firmicutes bacterium]|nr:glucose-6-phosphate isomerase [Bacillota bacterium]MCL2256147.1 glucose-6-phosphate isomerase [Bacillota bacterium]